MEASFISSLSELSVPAISVIAIAYMLIKTNESREVDTKNFLEAMESKRKDDHQLLEAVRQQHESSMKEREMAFRQLEREVRTNILEQLAKNSLIMERVINHLDKH